MFVPAENRLEKCDDFATGPGAVFLYTRGLASWAPVGISMGAFDSALRYLKKRKQFGSPLASFQMVQEKLVKMLANIQSMWLVAWRVTKLAEDERLTHGQSALAKFYCTTRGRECVSMARELVGGNGIVDEPDFGVARAFVVSVARVSWLCALLSLLSLVCWKKQTNTKTGHGANAHL